MNPDEVSHSGRIVEVGQSVTKVEIVSESACASCHAAGLCTAAEAQKKLIEVPTDPSAHFAAGDPVDVVLTKDLGMKAVLICYVIPLFILLILAVSLSYTTVGELMIGLVVVVALALYYGVLYLFRDRVSDGYVFRIRRK